MDILFSCLLSMQLCVFLLIANTNFPSTQKLDQHWVFCKFSYHGRNKDTVVSLFDRSDGVESFADFLGCTGYGKVLVQVVGIHLEDEIKIRLHLITANENKNKDIIMRKEHRTKDKLKSTLQSCYEAQNATLSENIFFKRGLKIR